jgi:hypothetical protein
LPLDQGKSGSARTEGTHPIVRTALGAHVNGAALGYEYKGVVLGIEKAYARRCKRTRENCLMTFRRRGKLAPCSIWERLLPAQSRAKTVQDHIDELPMWVDGTLLSSPPMTRMQWRIWSLAAAGKFFTGFILFMTGVALPLFFNEFRNQASGARRY